MRAWLVVGVVAAGAALSPLPTHAFDECGAVAPGGSATCNNDGNPATDVNPYPLGIRYLTNLTLTVDGTAAPIVMNIVPDVTPLANPNGGNGIRVDGLGDLVLSVIGSVTINVGPVVVDRDGILMTSLSGGSVIIDSTANINVSNNAGEGIVGRSTGFVSITSRGTLVVSGANSAGITAQSGRSLFVDSQAITMSGTGSPGIVATSLSPFATDSATVIARGPIATAGNSSPGIAVQTAAAPINVTTLDGITTTGSSAPGMALFSGGSLFVDSQAISTVGAISPGIFLQSTSTSTADSSAVIARGQISTTGDTAPGITVSTAAAGINVSTLVGITTAGTSAPAVSLTSGTGNLQLVNAGVLRAEATQTVSATGAGLFTLNNSGTISSGIDLAVDTTSSGSTSTDRINNAGLVIGRVTLGSGDDIFTNQSGGRFAARTDSGFGGSAADLFDNQAGAILAVAGSGVESVRLNGLGTFRNAGLITMQDSVTNIQLNGSVIAGPAVAGDTLIIQGSYVGAGGRLAVDTLFQGATGVSDRLVIQGGSTSGTTIVSVTQVAGSFGGATGTGPGAGIPVIDVSAGTATSPGQFLLEGGVVPVGPFGYRLNLESDNIWYLQSDVMPQFPAYAAALSGTLRMGEVEAGTLHERLGDLRHHDRTQSDGPVRQFWMRSFGRWEDFDRSAGTPFSVSMVGIEVGVDYGWRNLLDSGDRLYVGLFGGWGSATVKARSSSALLPGTTRISVDGPIGGLYATYQHNASKAMALYADIVLLGQRLAYDTYNGFGQATYKGWMWAQSLETGLSVRLGGGWLVEPQAQLIHSRVSHRAFTDPGSNVTVDDRRSDSLKGRVGARLQHDVTWDGGIFSPYVKANVWHEFRGRSTVDAGGVRLASNLGGTSYEVGIGFTASLGGMWEAFGNVDYNFGPKGNGIDGVIGVKIAFGR